MFNGRNGFGPEAPYNFRVFTPRFTRGHRHGIGHGATYAGQLFRPLSCAAGDAVADPLARPLGRTKQRVSHWEKVYFGFALAMTIVPIIAVAMHYHIFRRP